MATPQLPLPRSVLPYWLLSVGVVVGFPVTSLVYFPALLNSGALPTNGDSISIPMFESTIFAVIIAPLVAGVTYVCLRHYRSDGSLLIWRRDRPALSFIVSFIFGSPAILLILSAAQIVFERLPLIEYIWIPYTAICLAWLSALRAAVLTSAKPARR